MAKLTVDGIDGILINVMRIDSTLRGRIDRALELSGAVVQEAMRQEGKRTFKEPTGELEEAVKPGRVRHFPEASEIGVWPQGPYTGRRGKTRRAETVGFVIEYGVPPYRMKAGRFKGATRGRQAANPWMTRSFKKSEQKVRELIEEVIHP